MLKRFVLFALLIFAFPATQAQTRQTSNPYSGDLSIFESPGRDERLQINRVMDILGIGPGKNVADIGAGSGWFTVRAAKRVGDGGKIYALDINPEAVKFIDERVKREHLNNVTAILSPADGAPLPGKVDVVFILKTYHEIAEPITLLRNLRPSLAPQAKLGIIDRNGNGTDHGIDPKVIIKEADEAGYRMVERYDFVKDGMDYFLVFIAK
jgi:ubiquinone/menaquinone biosynthesis C-methylase UbiE